MFTSEADRDIRIVVADDHIVLRQGLKALLEAYAHFHVVGEACNGREAVDLVRSLSPDLIILDMSMPELSGLEAIARIKASNQPPQILVLSAKDDEITVNDALTAGAQGYLPKSAALDEVTFAIRAILQGKTYLSPQVCGAVINGKKSGKLQSSSPVGMLSAREREVMRLLCEGLPNRDVAKRLHISPRTVDSHRANIMKKLGIASNAELVQVAVRSGLID